MLNLKTFLIKERVAMLKLSDTYDIFDAENGHQVGQAREELPGWVKALKLLVNKKLLPSTVSIYDIAENPILRIRRGVALLRTKVMVYGGDGEPIGYFKSKL